MKCKLLPTTNPFAPQHVSVRDFLNDRKWHHLDLPACVVVILERRGPERGERRVRGIDVEKILQYGLLIAADPALDRKPLSEGDPEVYIPYHRVLRIEQNGISIWNR